MKKQILSLVCITAAALHADVEIISEQGSKPSKNVGIIEVRNDTKNTFGVSLKTSDDGFFLFEKLTAALRPDRIHGRLNGKDYLRITELVGVKTTDFTTPIDVTKEFTLQIYNMATKTSTNYTLKKNDKRKIIALVIEKDKDENISVRAQKGNKAKGFFTGSGSSSGIHLNRNITDDEIVPLA